MATPYLIKLQMHVFVFAFVLYNSLTGSRSTFEFPQPGQPFQSQFLLYLALWTGLAGAKRFSRSDFMLHKG